LTETYHYRERSLAALKRTLQKTNHTTESEMHCKTKENTTLIYDLNYLIFDEKKQMLAKQKLDDEIVVLDKEEKMLRRQAVRDMQGTTEEQEIV
jgi:hypothetical protein